MKIQPIDFNIPEGSIPHEPRKPVVKSRLKRLFERQFPSVMRISAGEKTISLEEPNCKKDGDFEPCSVCLAKMVQNFIEENNEKQPVTMACGRQRCNCFSGDNNESSEDEFEVCSCCGDANFTLSGGACEILKGLVPCVSVSERNLLADTAKIVDKNKICKRKDDCCRKIVVDGLSALGYDASVCKSQWEKSPLYPAGEYEYVDVIVEGERLIIDIDFRSEFEIARSTKTYKTILQTLPYIFIGKTDRLQKIISIVSEAAKQSLKNKGMHFPPWRQAEYVKAKWLSPYTRVVPSPASLLFDCSDSQSRTQSSSGELELIFGEKSDAMITHPETFNEEKITPGAKQWEPPEFKPKTARTGVKIVTGLASVVED